MAPRISSAPAGKTRDVRARPSRMVRCVYEYGSAFPPAADVVDSLEQCRTRDTPFEEPETRESKLFAQQFYHIKGAVYQGQGL